MGTNSKEYMREYMRRRYREQVEKGVTRFCELCECHVKPTSYYNHLKSRRHRLRVEAKEAEDPK